MQSSTATAAREPLRLVHSRPVREPDGWRDRQFNDIAELIHFVSDEIIASKIKYIRLAELSNCHPATISKMAHREVTFPRASTVLQILRALGFEVIVRG